MATDTTAPAQDAFRQEQAKHYARIRRRIALAGWILDALALVLLLATGLSAGLRNIAEQAAAQWPLALPVYLLMVGAIFEAISLPLDFYSDYVIEHRYGLSRMTVGTWAKDRLKSTGLGALLGIALGELFYWALERHPATWWLWVAGVLILFAVVMAQLAPVLLFPLFFKFRPLESEDLAARLRGLAARAGANVATVLEWKLGEKSNKANAALTGWGATRRILLADTLLDRHNGDEIETIVAHELGHQVHRDIPLAIAVESALAVLALWIVNQALVWATPRLGFRGLADFANLPLVLLIFAVVSLLTLPAVNAYSRWRERLADRYALRLTRNPGAFISAMQKLAEQNLAETEPGRAVEILFHNHPSIARRIAAAEQVRS
ncbi:MAG TPA: M48 family metallopeptidase [Candidatus Dormibacteraeota bacterium]|nr:M48 family metallopeptidase [Candidatus Dormibacteraeota bacterium]